MYSNSSTKPYPFGIFEDKHKKKKKSRFKRQQSKKKAKRNKGLSGSKLGKKSKSSSRRRAGVTPLVTTVVAPRVAAPPTIRTAIAAVIPRPSVAVPKPPKVVKVSKAIKKTPKPATFGGVRTGKGLSVSIATIKSTPVGARVTAQTVKDTGRTRAAALSSVIRRESKRRETPVVTIPRASAASAVALAGTISREARRRESRATPTPKAPVNPAALLAAAITRSRNKRAAAIAPSLALVSTKPISSLARQATITSSAAELREVSKSRPILTRTPSTPRLASIPATTGLSAAGIKAAGLRAAAVERLNRDTQTVLSAQLARAVAQEDFDRRLALTQRVADIRTERVAQLARDVEVVKQSGILLTPEKPSFFRNIRDFGGQLGGSIGAAGSQLGVLSFDFSGVEGGAPQRAFSERQRLATARAAPTTTGGRLGRTVGDIITLEGLSPKRSDDVGDDFLTAAAFANPVGRGFLAGRGAAFRSGFGGAGSTLAQRSAALRRAQEAAGQLRLSQQRAATQVSGSTTAALARARDAGAVLSARTRSQLSQARTQAGAQIRTAVRESDTAFAVSTVGRGLRGLGTSRVGTTVGGQVRRAGTSAADLAAALQRTAAQARARLAATRLRAQSNLRSAAAEARESGTTRSRAGLPSASRPTRPLGSRAVRDVEEAATGASKLRKPPRLRPGQRDPRSSASLSRAQGELSRLPKGSPYRVRPVVPPLQRIREAAALALKKGRRAPGTTLKVATKPLRPLGRRTGRIITSGPARFGGTVLGIGAVAGLASVGGVLLLDRLKAQATIPAPAQPKAPAKTPSRTVTKRAPARPAAAAPALPPVPSIQDTPSNIGQEPQVVIEPDGTITILPKPTPPSAPIIDVPIPPPEEGIEEKTGIFQKIKEEAGEATSAVAGTALGVGVLAAAALGGGSGAGTGSSLSFGGGSTSFIGPTIFRGGSGTTGLIIVKDGRGTIELQMNKIPIRKFTIVPSAVTTQKKAARL